MSPFFELSEQSDRLAYDEEAFIADVQYEISLLMKRKRVSRSELSRRLGVSPACVSQCFGDDGGNLTCRTIAKIFAALGERPKLSSDSSDRGNPVIAAANSSCVDDWADVSSLAGSSWNAEDISEPRKSTTESGSDVVVWLNNYRKAA